MTPEECIDLVTPEADKQPCTRHSALPSLDAVVVTSLFDLTADTPSPVSARGIVDDGNDRRGSEVRHDSDRLPNLPRLHETHENKRSNTLHALAPVTAPVTNSSSSPRRKKSRLLRCQYSGKENSSSNVSAFGSTPVENRKFPLFIPKLTPGGRENLSPVVDDLVGKTHLLHYQHLAWILTHYRGLMSNSLSWREQTNFGDPKKFLDI